MSENQGRGGKAGTKESRKRPFSQHWLQLCCNRGRGPCRQAGISDPDIEQAYGPRIDFSVTRKSRAIPMSDQLMRFETILNNSRYRSIIAGGIGALLGWLLAETVVPIVGGPKTFGGVGLIGSIVGAGIGIALGIAEGVVIHNWHQVLRGAIVGATVGASAGRGQSRLHSIGEGANLLPSAAA